ncbi:hypothetical protein B7494_g1789 [Chlorociboria aeruginascens]|nr:hypothetical protein B7494_g1789 [Chlorociboria aeruginascens]
MRQNNQSVVHHIYYDPAEDGTEGTYGYFSVHHEEVTQDPDVAIQAVNNENRRWRRTLFSGGNSNEAAVGYSRMLNAYYLIDGTGMIRQVTLTKDTTTNNYYFTHPETQQLKWAYFPVGVPTPAPE